ncbi:MAG TPA: xanthine dehydrogenase family protein subunit M [Anaerolineales bacterium]|nr:xanthine dehydrogenase family protein subunit M [Anaerolineales bacterium]
MKPARFKYLAPSTLEDALAHLSEAGNDGKLLAGGQSLVPMMNFRLVQPTVLIDLNPIRELDYLVEGEDKVRVGGMTRLSRLEGGREIRGKVPLLSEALPHIAHTQIRTRGTIGGSLAHADPAAELPVVAIAADARVKVKNRQRERWLTAREFFVGTFTTALEEDEILTEVEFPQNPPRTGWAFLEFARREGDYALAGVAVRITLAEDATLQDVRLVYLNAGDGPLEATQAAFRLTGERYSSSGIAEAARIAAETEISPLGNVHASPAYQRHLAEVLTRSALERAYQRARDALPL